MLNASEFIDTYSDDLLYIMEFRKTHLSHPGIRPIPLLHEQSFTRIFCAFMMGNLEAMFNHWKDRDDDNVLEPYFAKSDISNEMRIDALYNSFRARGIKAEKEILEKFLAIKYLRNSIIHSGWKKNQLEYIEKMGFPTDTRLFNESHLEIMFMVNNKMMLYIAAVEMPGIDKWQLSNTLPKIKRVFNKDDLANFLWINMERRYENLSIEPLTDKLIEEVIFDWKLFKEVKLKNIIPFENIDVHITLLEPIVVDKLYPDVPIGFLNLEEVRLWNDEERQNLMPTLIKILNQKEEVIFPLIDALAIGAKCYQIMVNYTVSKLLERLANFKEVVNETSIREEALIADKLFRLGRLYYNYAEMV